MKRSLIFGSLLLLCGCIHPNSYDQSDNDSNNWDQDISNQDVQQYAQKTLDAKTLSCEAQFVDGTDNVYTNRINCDAPIFREYYSQAHNVPYDVVELLIAKLEDVASRRDNGTLSHNQSVIEMDAFYSEMNTHIAQENQMNQQNRLIESQEREQDAIARQANAQAAAARMNAFTNLMHATQPQPQPFLPQTPPNPVYINQPTNCTSNLNGNYVYTNCN